MKTMLISLLAGCLLLSAGSAAEEGKLTFYIQLVRGTDESKPPTPGSKRIGSKLGGELRAVFAWKHYWEVSQHEVLVAPGAHARLKLNSERAVRIDLRVAGKRKVTAYFNDKPVFVITDPRDRGMSIMGGDRDARSSWFIVVRRDKPSID